VSQAISKLAAWLRVAYAGVFVVPISQLVGALRVHPRALQGINTFTDIWDPGLVLFGMSLFVLAYPVFALWLVIRGRRIASGDSAWRDDSIGATR